MYNNYSFPVPFPFLLHLGVPSYPLGIFSFDNFLKAFAILSDFRGSPLHLFFQEAHHRFRAYDERGTYLLEIPVQATGFPRDRSLSTSEAEYMAASLCGQKIVYIRAILRDFGLSQSQPTLVYEDNLACIAMSINPVRRKYSRHIDIRKHYLRELCLSGIVKLIHCTHHMVADALR
jgi:hypothetical protein